MAELLTLGVWLTEGKRKQAELVRHLGVSAPTVSEWVAGTRKPTLGNAVKIESFTGGAVRVESFGLDLTGVEEVLARRREASAKPRRRRASPPAA